MKTTIYALLSLLIFVSQLFSIGQEWVSRYNGTANTVDWSYAIALDASGNVYVTGYTTGSGTSKDYRTIKYSPAGVILWTASFNGPVNGGDYSYALAVDASANVYVTGRVDYGPTLSDIITIKYNTQGVQQWFARYNGPSNNADEGRSIQVDAGGNVYVGGKSFVNGNTFDFITIKYNSNGTESWVSTYNGAGNNEDIIASLAVDNSGNVYVAGSSVGSSSGSDFAVIKYNSAGTEEWVKRYNGANNGGDGAVSVRVDASGNVYASGYTYTGGVNKFDIVTLKYNSAGAQQWIALYNGAGISDDIATAMTIDASSNICITGVSASIVSPVQVDSDYVTLKYNSDGQFQWAAGYEGPNGSVDISRSIATDNSGNIYISGSSMGTSSDDYTSIKYSPSGNVVWLMKYNGTAGSNDYSNSIVADNNGYAYVTGRSLGTGTDYDYATIKYSDIVGINPVNTEIPSKFNLYQNYPNPFNPSTKIKFDLPEKSSVIFKLFNSLGQEILSNSLGELNPSSYEYNLNANQITSGVYFYKIITGNYSAVKKMILIK